MTSFIWCWQKGATIVFTNQLRRAEQAMREGYCVKVKREKPHIINN